MNAEDWRGRVDAEDGEAGRRWHQVVRPWGAEGPPGVALLGFASDAGIVRNQGRAGAAEGPRALRRALAPLAYHGAKGTPLYDAGDVVCGADLLEAAQAEFGARVTTLIATGHFPLLLGGGHEMAWASFQGLQPVLARDGRLARFGVVNIDAHFDLREAVPASRSTSGTPFTQISAALGARGMPFRYLCLGIARASNTPVLFQRASALGAQWIEDTELTAREWDAACRVIDEFIAGVDALQLSVCLDAFPAAAAPGVSAPAARGIAVDVALGLIAHVLDRGQHGTTESKVVLAEIAELSPPFDPDGRTARLAARIAHDIATPLL
jgi:formiminoglutamase